MNEEIMIRKLKEQDSEALDEAMFRHPSRRTPDKLMSCGLMRVPHIFNRKQDSLRK